MTERRRDLIRALWCAAKASGGTLRIGRSIFEDFPGDKNAYVIISRDNDFGDVVIAARVKAGNDQ